MMHIKNTLPDIKARISSSLQKYTAELQQLGDSILGNSANIVLQIITEFCNEYRTVLDGNNQELSSVELSGGARISFVFHELYSNGVKAVDPFDQVKDIDIRTILYNSSGSSPALFVGTTAFELIVKQQIKRLEDPSLKCVSLVYDELVRILGQLLQKQLFRRYPALKEKFHAVAISFFKRIMDPTNKLVRDLVAMESCYVNTGHPDFLNGHRVGAFISQFYDQKRNVGNSQAVAATEPASTQPQQENRSSSPRRLAGKTAGFEHFHDAYAQSKLASPFKKKQSTNPSPQAMAIVNERHSGGKPTQVDPKTGRPLQTTAGPPRAASPSLDSTDSSQGFFGSFFTAKNKKKMAAMDSPPPQLKASGTLSEKESNEVEVISMSTASRNSNTLTSA